MEGTGLRGPQRDCRVRSTTQARLSAALAIGLALAGTLLGCASIPGTSGAHQQFPGATRSPGHQQYADRLSQQITGHRRALPGQAPDSLRRSHRGLWRTGLATRRASAGIPWASPAERHRRIHRLHSRNDDTSECPHAAVRGRRQRCSVAVLGGIRTPDGPDYALPVLVTLTDRTPGSNGNG